jgi:outer membrane protein assembly factor BamB
MRMKCTAGRAVLMAVVSAVAATSRANDWPQWLGPERNGEWTETEILDKFPDAGPKVKWRAKIAGGYSGPAVAQGRVFVSDYARKQGDPKSDPSVKNVLQGDERLVCLDEQTGNELWVHSTPRTYEISYPAGPRATPTVDGDRVYFLGAEGNFECLSVKNGKVLWEKDFKRDYKSVTPVWGFAAHPLIDGERLYITPGGPGAFAVCLDKKSGKELWRSLTAKDAGYCPPTMIDVGGKKQLVIWTPETLNGLNPDTGSVEWTVPLEPNFGMSIVAPVQVGDSLFAGGVTKVGVMLKLAGAAPPPVVWKTSQKLGIGPVHSPVLVVGSTLYGVDAEGELTAVEAATGKKLWETFAATTGDRRANSATAFLVRNGDRFFIFNEKGDLIIAKLTPEKYEELSRTHVIEPTQEAWGRKLIWSCPAFANRCVFVRNDNEIVCVDLSAK